MALAVQNEEEDVEAILKRLGIVIDDRVDACLRFKSLGSMRGAMETLSAWATAHPEGKFALRKRGTVRKGRGVYHQRVVCTREGRPNPLSSDRSRLRMSQRCDCKFQIILVGLRARHLSGDDLPSESSASRVSSQATFASAEDAPLCGLAECAFENDDESIRWFVKSVSEEGHNHELDAADSLLAQYRTLPVAIKTQLAMYASTRAPQELHQLACDFAKNNDIQVTWERKDIANYVMRFERTPLALQAQELVDQCHALKASSEFFQFKVDFDNDSRRLVAISMIFDEGVRHWSRSADILLLDSTHGTNNAGMRLILYITLGSSLESVVLGM